MIIDCISDLHGNFPSLPGGDLLIVAGDFTARDTVDEHMLATDWMHIQPYKKVIFIAGNHDNVIGIVPRTCDHVEYLCDSGTDFQGLKIWGSPWTKTFPRMNPKCKAFTKDTEEELAERWALIPEDTDILITHGPPYGVFDEVHDYEVGKIKSVGSSSMFDWCVKHHTTLRLHVFGHVHGGRSIYDCRKNRRLAGYGETTVIVNASYVDENYRPVYNAVRLEL